MEAQSQVLTRLMKSQFVVSRLIPSQRLISVGLELFVTPFKVDLRLIDSVDRLKEGRERMLGRVLRCPRLPRVIRLAPITADRLRVVTRVLLQWSTGVLAADEGRVIVAVLYGQAQHAGTTFLSIRKFTDEQEYDGGEILLPHELGSPAILVRRASSPQQSRRGAGCGLVTRHAPSHTREVRSSPISCISDRALFLEENDGRPGFRRSGLPCSSPPARPERVVCCTSR